MTPRDEREAIRRMATDAGATPFWLHPDYPGGVDTYLIRLDLDWAVHVADAAINLMPSDWPSRVGIGRLRRFVELARRGWTGDLYLALKELIAIHREFDTKLGATDVTRCVLGRISLPRHVHGPYLIRRARNRVTVIEGEGVETTREISQVEALVTLTRDRGAIVDMADGVTSITVGKYNPPSEDAIRRYRAMVLSRLPTRTRDMDQILQDIFAVFSDRRELFGRRHIEIVQDPFAVFSDRRELFGRRHIAPEWRGLLKATINQ